MVDELTQESFQTGKAIVTVSVDLITAIADACKRSEQQNPGMSEEQKETLLGKVVDKVMSNYRETHGSLKGFNREGKDVTHRSPYWCHMDKAGICRPVHAGNIQDTRVSDKELWTRWCNCRCAVFGCDRCVERKG